ncbi:MAG: acyloxyacyl hydrolase [Phycisphaerae bacterium]|nr:acyloxyacyl hydrolase [Phycisphaerae bacterium]
MSLTAAMIVAFAAASVGASQAPPSGAALLAAPAAFALEPPTPPARSQEFGAEGSTWLTVGAGWAPDFAAENDFNLHLAWSKFLVKDVEFALEGAGWYADQSEHDAFGGSASMIFRCHFVNTGDWTVYADLGIGAIASSDDVPEGGSSFNLHPRAGAGLTRRLDDAGTRLQVGVRWHHVSNARIFGDGDNPARDRAMFYADLVLPLR